MLLLFISKYDRKDDEIDPIDLPGTANDKKRLHDLFTNKYGDTVIQTENDKVTKKKFEKKLNEARVSFANGKYDTIFIFFGGHGDENWFCASDKKKISRSKSTSCFNGLSIPTKTDLYKFYFIDSCRGSKEWNVSKGADNMGVVNNPEDHKDAI